MIWPFFLSPFGREERWKAINDDEKPLAEVLQNTPLTVTYLGTGDAVNMPDGKLWICTRGGTRETAWVVEGRYKKPTEMFP